MGKYDNDEFFEILEPVLNDENFTGLEDIKHHGITRLDHCLRVSYFSYKICKALKLNYQDVAVAALLHDFFTDEVENLNIIKRLRLHPLIACDNACKYFNLNEMQKDIIKTHMFPITFTPPKYIESWIVDIVDDLAAIYEKAHSTKKEWRAATTFLFLIVLNYIKFLK